MKPDHLLSPKEFARLLRKNQTKEEAIIWELVRNRKLLGYKFLRQYPIQVWQTNLRFHYYYADFYCSEKRLVVEIDGLIHTTRRDYDQSRDQEMKDLKLTVLRITNEEVNNDIMGVLKKIKALLLIPIPSQF